MIINYSSVDRNIQLHWFRLIICLLRVLQSIEFQIYDYLHLDIIDVIKNLCYYTFFEYVIISFVRLSTRPKRLEKVFIDLTTLYIRALQFPIDEILKDPRNKTFRKVDFNYSITVLMDDCSSSQNLSRRLLILY